MRTLPVLALTLLLLTGCQTEPADAAMPTATDATAADAPAPVAATLEDGVQVVHLTVSESGYEPAAIALQAGVPTRLVVTRTGDAGCGNDFRIPDLGVEQVRLSLDTPTPFTFTPTATGTFHFMCSMDLCHQGTITVHA